MVIITYLQDIKLLSKGVDLSKLSGEEQQSLLREIYDYLPEGSNFTVDEELLTITIPESQPSQKAEAERLAEKAAQRARKGEYGKAKDIYRRVLELDPIHPRARRDLAMIHVESGEDDEAKDLLIEALRLSPDDAWSFIVLANQYFKANDHETARKFLHKALELKPGDPWALNSLGASLLETDSPEKALIHFDEAIKSDNRFPNAYFGRANVLLRQEKYEEAVRTLEKMFAEAQMQDSRSQGVYQQARDMYRRLQNILANNRVAETGNLLKKLSKEGASLSGYPVVFEEGPLEALIAAKIKMAWKHKADHHTLILREGKMPEILKHHHSAHELMHLFMESEARDQGCNRWFVTTPETRAEAIQSLRKDIKRLEQNGFHGDQVAKVINELISGASAFLLSCPLDMVIERRMRNNYPELREAQFCGVIQLAHEALQSTMNPELRKLAPPGILRINDILNGVYALFVDDLLESSTTYAENYKRLSTFSDSERLYRIWKNESAELTPGGEYNLVDIFADFLGIRGWYTWKTDPRFIPPQGILEKAQEGVTNPNLLKMKGPASVCFLLDALNRYESMEEENIRSVLMEIAVSGMSGFDYSSPDQKYRLDSLPNESFSGLHLMCLMYAAGQRLMPGESMGMDLNDEYFQALELYQSEN